MLTDNELAAIRARAMAPTLTFGPWVASYRQLILNAAGEKAFPQGFPAEMPVAARCATWIMTGWDHGQARAPIPIVWLASSSFFTESHFPHMEQADAEFIAHARADIPALLATIDALRETIANLETDAEERIMEEV
jgi:hypothetical protein